MLTHALLRESISATSAMLIWCVVRSSTTKRACSRMLSGFCLPAAPIKLAMPCVSRSPHETYGTHWMPSFSAQR